MANRLLFRRRAGHCVQLRVRSALCFPHFFLALAVIATCIFFFACKAPGAPPLPVEKRDTSITPVNAYSDLFLDSAQFDAYVEKTTWHDSLKAALHNFYNARNYQYAWLNDTGFTEQAFAFGSMLTEYTTYSGDSVAYDPLLKTVLDSASQRPLVLTDSLRFRFELSMSAAFLRYARRAYQGNVPLSEKDLGWFIPRKRINPLALLDSFVKAPKGRVPEPVNPQYQQLRAALLRYHQLKQAGGFPAIPAPAKTYRVGDTAAGIVALKKRLSSTGDFNAPDSSTVFTPHLLAAVKSFQERYGLRADGVVGGRTLRFLNESIDRRIEQILLNMERMRWVPAQPQGDFVLVNIPQYRLTVFEDGRPAFGMNIVVGTSQNKTVIFTGKLKWVVFAPYWNVPPGILKNEVLPAIRRNASYLRRNHMEWANGGVRQTPGPWNALGRVKFLFPNEYNIYLHDTPAKSLFGEETRSFSHGCIRVAEPQKLAAWVLRNDQSWTNERIEKAMNAGTEQYVTVKGDIPVFIGYFTAWVDERGRLNFRDDIYGHDKQLAAHLFTAN